MTPRLRILSIGLALSLAYAIYDYVERNSDNRSRKTTATKETKKRARTAGVSASRYESLKAKWARMGGTSEKATSEDFNAQSGFLPISDQVSSLDGWDRNPFVEVYEPQVVPITRKTDQTIEIEEEINLAKLDGLIIETAIRMGEKAFVTINGQTFTEGDLINDALIEKIENEQITFKVGKTRIIKDVGT